MDINCGEIVSGKAQLKKRTRNFKKIISTASGKNQKVKFINMEKMNLLLQVLGPTVQQF